MRIICDQDGVLVDILTPWLKKLNRYHGEALQYEDVTQWAVHKVCKNTKEHEVYKYLNDRGFFLHAEEVEMAPVGIRRLMDAGHDVIIVTTCHYGHEDKKEWVRRHIPDFPVEDNMIFARRKYLIRGDVFIDDSEQNLIDYQRENPDAMVICFDAPHNGLYDGYRACTWLGVIDLIERFSKVGRLQNAK